MCYSSETVFSKLSDDVILNIFTKLEDDPRHWARIACVCTKFSSLVHSICFKSKCLKTMRAVCADLFPGGAAVSVAAPVPGGWPALYKLAVCCPGLLHSGVLLENSDFGLERELGPDEIYREIKPIQSYKPEIIGCSSSSVTVVNCVSDNIGWSLYDDLFFDTEYNSSENSGHENVGGPGPEEGGKEKVRPGDDSNPSKRREVCGSWSAQSGQENVGLDEECKEKVRPGVDYISSSNKRRKICFFSRAHLASGVWNLSREQGNKLLASRFKGDCLYICDWPGCVHVEEKRNYMLFRGIFKDFKQSRVWRTINDGNRSRIDLNCAFCEAKETWDLHSSFCLRRYFGFHDDGEPVVRAYVCENGHVSGAWTDWPLYT